MNFENRCKAVYNECNVTAEYLAQPLDMESKPALFIERIFDEIYYKCNIEPLFERVLREAVEEALISEEKSAHERHAPQKSFEWYYFGGSAEDINARLAKHEPYFNKDYNDKDGNVIRYHSYKITDDNDETKEVIGWLNYITVSFKDEQGNTVKSISNIKLKQETPGSQDTCFQQAMQHLVSQFQSGNISSITWKAANKPLNKRVNQYKSLCQRFGGSWKSSKDESHIIYTIPKDAFLRNKTAILNYFRLN
jgi:hypothetical protein